MHYLTSYIDLYHYTYLILAMADKLVGLVKPFHQKTGTWLVSMPKDVVVQSQLEVHLKSGAKIPVYFDEEKKQLIYQLPLSDA